MAAAADPQCSDVALTAEASLVDHHVRPRAQSQHLARAHESDRPTPLATNPRLDRCSITTTSSRRRNARTATVEVSVWTHDQRLAAYA